MNSDQVKQIIQSLGAMVEMWSIVFNGFKQQGFNDDAALSHTSAFMSVMITGILGIKGNNEEA